MLISHLFFVRAVWVVFQRTQIKNAIFSTFIYRINWHKKTTFTHKIVCYMLGRRKPIHLNRMAWHGMCLLIATDLKIRCELNWRLDRSPRNVIFARKMKCQISECVLRNKSLFESLLYCMCLYFARSLHCERVEKLCASSSVW